MPSLQLSRGLYPAEENAVIYTAIGGSNFVGAKRKLMEFENFQKSNNYNQNVTNFLSDNGIKWHLNVPGAPHMGGLWEAGIKINKISSKTCCW
ncbi:reverse transcriptase [Caerostris extrusa]|uniref:Reverse transcriptase n=1 Tax=Caerostris extrusa TaxID=172846 RepID=A0AAV4T6V7_CAEEX|nr:reverse transcriptase [Caerostris extrusa]